MSTCSGLWSPRGGGHLLGWVLDPSFCGIILLIGIECLGVTPWSVSLIFDSINRMYI